MLKTKFAIYSIFLLGMVACSGPKNTSTTDNNSDNTKKEDTNMTNADYHEMKQGESLSKFVDKKVVFDGKISQIPMQHMMRYAPPMGENAESEEHKYIEPAEPLKFGQIVAYYLPSKVKWPSKEEGLRFYGMVGSMSGAGKGGGEHTEIYIILDKVESSK